MIRSLESLLGKKIEPNYSRRLPMYRVWLSGEVGEEPIHGGVVRGKAVCLNGLAEHLPRFEPPLPSLAPILPIRPGAEITPKTQCKLFGPLLRCANIRKVYGEPTSHGKQASHVVYANIVGKVDFLMKPGEAPGVPLLVHAIAIKGRGSRKRLWCL